MIQPITSVQFNKQYNKNLAFKSQYIPHEVHITPEMREAMEKTLEGKDKVLIEKFSDKVKPAMDKVKNAFKKFQDEVSEGLLVRDDSGEIIGHYTSTGDILYFTGEEQLNSAIDVETMRGIDELMPKTIDEFGEGVMDNAIDGAGDALEKIADVIDNIL